MKKIQLFIIGFILSSGFCFGQTTWEKLFSNKSTDVFRSVTEVPSGGYAIAGYTSDSTVSDTDAYVVRINTLGDTLWTFRHNIGLSKKDLFYKIINTADGGFVMCGYTNSVTGVSDDILFTKINGSGQLVWTKTWGGSGKDRAQDIVQLADGTFGIVGYTTSAPAQYYDAFFYRVDANGDSLWFKRYGSAAYDDANTIKILANGGFLLGGQSSNGANGFDQFLIRTNDSGDTLWTRKFGTIGSDNIESLAIGPDGYYMVGSTNGAGVGGDDGYLVKTDTTGTVQFSKTFGGSAPDDLHRVELTADGGLVMSGTTSSTGPLNPNMWIVRANANGDSLWSRAFGGDNHDHGYSGQQTTDGGYILAGHTGSFGFNGEEAFVVKMDANGNIANLLTYIVPSVLVSPTTSTCGGSGIIVKIIIRNFGANTVPNVPAQVVITGDLSQTINGLYSGAFHPQDADTLTFSTPINTTGGGTYTFTISTLNTNDVVPARNTITVTLTLDGNSGAPSVANVARCGTGTVTLNAVTSGNVYWFSAASGGAPLASGSSFTTPSISGNTIYYAQTGLACPSSRTSATAIVDAIPALPVLTQGYSCGTGTVNLSASSPNSVNWYDAAVGGTLVGTGLTLVTPSIVNTTTFYAEADNGICRSSTVAVDAVIYPIPSVSVGADTSIEIGTTYIITASPSYPVYNWSTSETTQSISVTAPANYCVTITDANNCSSTDCANVTFYVGINNNAANNQFIIYPNPANNKLNISLSQTTENVFFQLTNVAGQIIVSKSMNHITPGSTYEISLEGIAPGVYFAKLMLDGVSFNQKIIVQ